jgi:hypothetical protein
LTDDLPRAFVEAVREGRFQDAATDLELNRRWSEREDGLAGALVLVCGAHHHAEQGNPEGARAGLGRAVRHLERLPLDPYAALLIEHARRALRALQGGTPLPDVPLGFR